MIRLLQRFKVVLSAGLVLTPLGGGAAQAALSGFYDSAAKIEAILAAAEVGDALRQAPVRSIEEEGMAEGGLSMWVVHSQECDLQVGLRGVPPAGPGRVQWVVETVGTCD